MERIKDGPAVIAVDGLVNDRGLPFVPIRAGVVPDAKRFRSAQFVVRTVQLREKDFELAVRYSTASSSLTARFPRAKSSRHFIFALRTAVPCRLSNQGSTQPSASTIPGHQRRRETIACRIPPAAATSASV